MMNDQLSITSVRSALQAAQWAIAHEWHSGLGLEYAGVDLGEALTYTLLTVVGRLLKRDTENAFSMEAGDAAEQREDAPA